MDKDVSYWLEYCVDNFSLPIYTFYSQTNQERALFIYFWSWENL